MPRTPPQFESHPEYAAALPAFHTLGGGKLWLPNSIDRLTRIGAGQALLDQPAKNDAA